LQASKESNMRKKHLIILVFLISGTSSAQKNELGIFVGSSGYYGDIGHNQIGAIFSHQSPAIGLSHKINFHDYLSFRSSILYGTLKADDALSNDPNTQSRNLSFQSQIIDINMGFEFNFKKFKIHRRKTIYSPYIFAGLSFFTFNPQAQNNLDQWVDLQSLGTEGQETEANSNKKYKLNSFAVPFGIGYKANLNEKIALSIEWIWRTTATDYIDDVSGYYVNSSLLSDEAAEMANQSTDDAITGKRRGNPNNNDWYNFTGFTISYKIKNRCG
jgi:hypothetical protein